MCFQNHVGINAGVIRSGMFSLQRPNSLSSFSVLATGWMFIAEVAASVLRRVVSAKPGGLGACLCRDVKSATMAAK